MALPGRYGWLYKLSKRMGILAGLELLIIGILYSLGIRFKGYSSPFLEELPEIFGRESLSE